MPKVLKKYTVSAIYDENDQRFAAECNSLNATDAALETVRQALEDNESPETVAIMAIFEGDHGCLDTTVMYAAERPVDAPSLSTELRDFTVVTDQGVDHVQAFDAIKAELAYDEDVGIAGIFAGHLVNVFDQVDFARFERESAVMEADAAA